MSGGVGAITRRMKASGWSPTTYSWNRLQAAAGRGDLFVQHLAKEARIVCDRDERLAHLLSRFSPNANYQCEQDNAIRLLLTAEKVVRTYSVMLWALDIAAVA